ncbi:hypothetical protein CFP59_00114 [Streptomyces malaysiensis subsp. malaysiensis]|nr:hypothetical protein CFP59_00114 [Streptomyces sp. M56]
MALVETVTEPIPGRERRRQLHSYGHLRRRDVGFTSRREQRIGQSSSVPTQQVAYAAGFTGLGVGATRFGAEVILDLLAGERTERTALELVRRKPLPFPPEPVRSIGIGITKWSLARADRNEGRRNLWLRTLDRVGLGFDS